MKTRRFLHRIHIWLGWIIGVPLLFWTVSGLWMVARPIEEVRGTALRADPAPINLADDVVAPQTGKRAIKALALEQQPSGVRWIITFADGAAARADPKSGFLMPPLEKVEAETIADAAFKGEAKPVRTTRFAADANPIDLRRERPAWQVHYADGTNVYVDADTGQVLALRTQQWRIFDWMWGLHIMDLQTREETSHPVLILFAGLAALGVLLALILLPIAVWRRRS